MSIIHYEHIIPNDTHEYDHYEITFFEDNILTLLTETPHSVDMWISENKRKHRRRCHSLIVGLDVEWRPNRN